MGDKGIGWPGIDDKDSCAVSCREINSGIIQGVEGDLDAQPDSCCSDCGFPPILAFGGAFSKKRDTYLRWESLIFRRK